MHSRAVDCFPPKENDDAYTTSAHLAYITGLLGPPSPDFIEPDTISAKYFDKDGKLAFFLLSGWHPLTLSHRKLDS